MEDITTIIINDHEISMNEVLSFEISQTLGRPLMYWRPGQPYEQKTCNVFYDFDIELSNGMTLTGNTKKVEFYVVKQVTEKIKL